MLCCLKEATYVERPGSRTGYYSLVLELPHFISYLLCTACCARAHRYARVEETQCTQVWDALPSRGPVGVLERVPPWSRGGPLCR